MKSCPSPFCMRLWQELTGGDDDNQVHLSGDLGFRVHFICRQSSNVKLVVASMCVDTFVLAYTHTCTHAYTHTDRDTGRD